MPSQLFVKNLIKIYDLSPTFFRGLPTQSNRHIHSGLFFLQENFKMASSNFLRPNTFFDPDSKKMSKKIFGCQLV